MTKHAPTRSNILQSIVLRYVYYRMERVGARRIATRTITFRVLSV